MSEKLDSLKHTLRLIEQGFDRRNAHVIQTAIEHAESLESLLSASQAREDELSEKLGAMTVERDLYASDAKRCWEHMPELADSDADYELHEAVHTLKQRAEAAEAGLLKVNSALEEYERKYYQALDRAEAAEKLYADEQDMRIAEEKLRRAAETKIKASQDQEPVGRVNGRGIYHDEGSGAPFPEHGSLLYSAPVIPPELAELQRRIVELEAQLRK